MPPYHPEDLISRECTNHERHLGAMKPHPSDHQPTRVLLIVNSLLGAGAEVSLRALQQRLGEYGVETQLSTLTALGVGPEDTDVEVLADRYPGRREAVARTRAALRRHHPDLVHTTLFESDLVGRIAARLEGVPAVTSLVSTPYAPAAREAEPVSALKLRGAQLVDWLLARYATTGFHAISQAVADAAKRDLRVAPERIGIIPRGRDAALLGERTAERRAKARAGLGIDAQVPLLLAVGREEPQKNHATLVEAFARLRTRRPDSVLAIAGRPGRATPSIDAAAHRSALSPDALRRLGARSDVSDLLTGADVFAFPSLWEGLGGSAIEAMALHTPIVAGDVPALRELLADGDCGVLADPKDSIALADALEYTLAEARAASLRAARARQRFEAHYTLEASAKGMAAFYRNVLQRV